MNDALDVPVIDLSKAPGTREAWDRPIWVIGSWFVVEALLVTNPLQISSKLRTAALRAFGAQIGPGVIIRPRVRVKFPWKLQIGARCWIGEGVWFHNQDRIQIGADVVVSQDTFLTTGSHRARSDMSLVTRPVIVEDGAWLTTRCIVLSGTHVGRSALARPGTVLHGSIPANAVVSGSNCEVEGTRFGPSASQ